MTLYRLGLAQPPQNDRGQYGHGHRPLVPAQPARHERGEYGPAAAAAPPVQQPSSTEMPTWLKWVLGLSAAGTVAWLVYESSLTTREVHDREVKRAAKEKLRQGYDVFADIAGWPKPPITNGRRADVVAIRGRKVRLVEVEHWHTLDTTHTRDQVDDLAEYCESATDIDCEFELRVTNRRVR